MKKQIIGAIIIYIIGSVLITELSIIHETTADEVLRLLILVGLIDGLLQMKEKEKLQAEIKMLESRIDTLRDRINGTSFDS